MHPPDNPRATSQWRSLPTTTDQPSEPKELNTLQTSDETPHSETDMRPETIAQGEKSNAKPLQPDWSLFHALQTTRLSLAELNQMAKSTPPMQDMSAHLRAIDAQISGTRNASTVPVQAADGQTPVETSPSVRLASSGRNVRAPSGSIAPSAMTPR